MDLLLKVSENSFCQLCAKSCLNQTEIAKNSNFVFEKKIGWTILYVSRAINLLSSYFNSKQKI